ncbi:hypothetical protein [Streptomyces sp. RKAG337]|uniref:hypothetical protein n=1 Tax=Streptomyces sp. RKAG337 TaxID=2893404 RepID=UPI002033DE3D|nr:hypothetical protein [Streptomyces sp. RKAG337]MCM2430446.1 hypothetical protein [Streptomyces sp. RKAG337]
MSKHQKGRRHRTVNRNPRPAGPARPPAAPRAPAAGRVVPEEEQSATRTPETSAQPAKAAKAAKPDVPRASEPVADGGLGHHAARTWEEVRSAGDGCITVEELCTAVGYQSRTVLKHLKVLAQDGLAEPFGERWRPTGQKLF